MPTSYPGGIDAFTNPDADGGAPTGDDLDSPGVEHDAQHANANDAIEAIEAELGTDPSGASASVKARIAAGETATAAAQADADAAQATADAALPLAGGTMTGDLILDHDPSVDLEAATKQYVDQAGYVTSWQLRSMFPVLSEAKAWYDARFDVISGNRMQDLSGNENHLDLVTDATIGEPVYLGHTGRDYLWMPGWDDMWLDTPAPAGLLGGAALDIRWAGNMEVSRTGITDQTKNFYLHQGSDGDTDVSWAIRYDYSNDIITFIVSDDGTSIAQVELQAHGNPSTRRALVLDYATGDVSLYEQEADLAITSMDDDLSDATWDLVDSASFGAAITPYASTADVRVSSTSSREEIDGSVADGGGTYEYLALRDDENGAIVAGFYAREITYGAWNLVSGYPPVGGQDTANETTFDGLAAETWTVHIFMTTSFPIVLVDRPLVVFEKRTWGETPVDDEVFNPTTGVVTVVMLTRNTRPTLDGNQFYSHKEWSTLHDEPGYEGLATSSLPGGVSTLVSDGTDLATSTPPYPQTGELSIHISEIDFDNDTVTAWTDGVAGDPDSLASVSPTSVTGVPLRVAMLKDSGSNKQSGSFELMTFALFHRALTEYERLSLIPAEVMAPGLVIPIVNSLFVLSDDISTSHTDGTEDDLQSLTIPAGMLRNDGDILRCRWSGSAVAHATATRRVRLYFGGTAFIDSTAYASTYGGSYVVDFDVIRVSSSVVRVAATGGFPAMSAFSPLPFAGGGYAEVTGLTLANSQIIKATGVAAGVGAAAADIVGHTLTVNYLPAP